MNIEHKRILVTGASGSLGRQLLYELSRRDCTPIAHVRPTSDTAYIDSLGLEKRVADVRFSDRLREIVKDVDAVIHTVAWVNFRRDHLTQFTGVNTMAPLELFRAAQEAGVERFVHVSSVAATAGVPRSLTKDNGDVGAPLKVDEESAYNLGHLRIPYFMTKRAAEEELLKQLPEGKTELVIVNPSIVVAPSRTGDDRGKARRRMGKLVMPSFPNRVNLVDIRDVAPGIIAALERGRSGHRYILAGDNISIRDLVLHVSSVLGVTPHLLTPPRWFLDAAARLSVVWRKLTGRSKISFYPDLVKLLDYDWAFSSIKARTELHYTNRCIYATLEDLLTNSLNGTYQRPSPEHVRAG